MQQIIQPGEIAGVIHAPASKSIMQRVCAAALLHHGDTIINNPGESDDDLTALEIIKKLGAKIINDSEGKIIIKGNSSLELKDIVSDEAIVLDCNESGLSLRMFTAIAAMSSLRFVINGSGSLLKRPIDFFGDVFPLLGVGIVTNNGKLPINLKGPLIPFDFQMDGSLSSQFLTGILFAISHKTEKQVIIDVSNLKSAPYIDITLEVLKDFGCDVINENYERFIINPARKIEKTMICNIEGDWSGASFLLVAGAIAGSIELKGLSLNSKQADRAIITALSLAEARISISDELIKVEKPFGNRKLRPFHFDATHCPDLFPPLVALAAYCDGISIIEGVNRLLHKESNRANSLQETFGKLGVKIILQDDWMIVHGGEAVTGGVIHSFQDHRIAMACSVAGLSAMSAVTVEESEVVKKSYPRFYKDVDLIRKK